MASSAAASASALLRPMVGVAGVVFDVTQPTRRRVLLIQRGKPPQTVRRRASWLG